MYFTPLFFNPSKKLLVAAMVFLSLLLAAYSPMASYSSAQAAVGHFKERVSTEINSRISELEKTLASIKIDVHLSAGDSSASITGQNASASISANQDGVNAQATGPLGGSVSASLTQDGFNFSLTFPKDLKGKVQTFVQGLIDQLKKLYGQVQDAVSIENIQKIAESIDAQFGISKLLNIQGIVTQAVQTITGLFDNLQTAAKNIQSQITNAAKCVGGLANGTSSVDVNASTKSGVVVSGSGEGCDTIKITSGDVVQAAQAQLSNIGTMLSTIGSVMSSVITLLLSLVTTATSIVSSLGGLANISTLTNLGSLTSSLSSITGLISSFSGILSQLDVVTGLSSNVQGLLGNLSGLLGN